MDKVAGYVTYMANELNKTIETVLTYIKDAEHCTGIRQKQYYREDIRRTVYGYHKYIQAIYDCNRTIPYSIYSDFVELGAAVEIEGISCIGHNITYLNIL